MTRLTAKPMSRLAFTIALALLLPCALGCTTTEPSGSPDATEASEEAGTEASGASETSEKVEAASETAKTQPAAGKDIKASRNADTTFAKMVENGEVHSIRVIGDSLTAGVLCDNSLKQSETKKKIFSDEDGDRYEVPDDPLSWAAYFRAWAHTRGIDTFVNAGIGGSTMERLAQHSDSWLDDGATVIVVMLGTNDIDWFTIDQYHANAEIALAAASNKCAHLVVVSPPNNAGTLYPNQCELNEVDQALTQLCAQYGWEHISLYDAVDPQSDDLRDDHVHPTPKGAKRLWTAFCDRLALPDALWSISINPQSGVSGQQESEEADSETTPDDVEETVEDAE